MEIRKFIVDDRIFKEIQWVGYPDNWEDKNELGMSFDEVDDIYSKIAEKEFEEWTDEDWIDEGIEDEYDKEERIRESASSIISVSRINKEGLLAYALFCWYGSWDNMKKNVRNCIEDEDYYYYETGCGYDTIDIDLLDGDASGMTRDEFIKFLQGKA